MRFTVEVKWQQEDGTVATAELGHIESDTLRSAADVGLKLSDTKPILIQLQNIFTEHIPPWKKLGHALSETIRYLELNADSTPNYGKRYRTGIRISTGFLKSSVNEIIAKRMAKRQQMRWNKHTVQNFLDVRIHVLNGTLEDAFRLWHRDFRPITAQPAAA